jgi:prevent-host-death family protein
VGELLRPSATESVRQSRVELRKLLDQARDGGHTVVTKHGDESAVIVPYDWLRSALPELFNDEALPLAGLRPIPTRRVVIGFRCQRRLTQGPAVRLADRRHSLRRCMVTVMRSAYVLVRCAVVVRYRCALWSEHGPRYAVKHDPKTRT